MSPLKLRIGAVCMAGTLIFSACSSDDTETNTGDDVTTTEAMADDETTTTEAMEDDAMEDDAMEDDAMEDDAMEDDAMEDDAMMGAFGPACGAVPTEGEGSFAGMADDPAATAASANPLLSTLVEAVVAADLVDTLNSEGPFTIFAPTNDAFAALPEEDLAAVLADKDLLTSILTYHVIAGQSLDAEALAGGTQASVQGAELTFGADGTTVDGASVICSDVPTANATVHIIDQVLMPAA